jgi:hypothetical protein
MRRLASALSLACAERVAFGQGGPPMITDDPGTPGNGKWENNFAIIFEHRPNETPIDLPEIDLNYGVAEHIQLTLQTAPVLSTRSGHGLIGGIGGTEAAVKWRFLDEATSVLDMSMFPRVIFKVEQSSVRRGLAEDGTRFQIPFKLRRHLAGCAWTPSSVRERALLAEANGCMELSGDLRLPNQQCSWQSCMTNRE